MKNKLIYAFIVVSSLCFVGCDDAQPIIPEATSNKETLYDVALNLGGFDEISGTSTRASSFNDRIKYLSYQVYEEDRRITYVDKTLLDADVTKTLNLKLPKGKYIVSIVAAQKKVAPFAGVDQIGPVSTYESKGFMYNDLTNEVFTLFQPLVVDDQNLTQNVKLTRPIGRIQLAVNDLSLAPSEAQAVYPVLLASGEYGGQTVALPVGFYYNLRSAFMIYSDPKGDISAAAESYNSVKIAKDKFATYNQSNPFTFYMPQLTNVQMIDVTAKSFDLYLLGSKDGNFTRDLKSPNIVFKKLLKKNIIIQANKSIKIEGSIFDAQGLNVTLNETWSDTSEEEF